MSLDVVTFGEAMAMFVADEPGELGTTTRFTLRPAGAELNVAIGLARLGLGVGWVSRLGRDAFGRFLRDVLDREGVDRAAVTTDARFPTGFLLKAGGLGARDPAVEYFRRGSAASHLSPADFRPEYFLSARHLHLTGIAPALSPTCWELALHALAAMRAAGRTISFDPNLRPALWPSLEVMAARINALADWVLPGVEEGRLLTGSAEPAAIADFYLNQGAQLVVVKLGPVGAYYKNGAEGGAGTVAARAVPQVVDTVGAGDGFAVGILSGLLENLPLAAAVARGNRIAGRVIQHVGDSEGLPTRAELDRPEVG